MNLFTSLFLIGVLLFSITPSSEAKHLSCGGDTKLITAGRPLGTPHNDIERAGIILMKDYGRDEPGKPYSRYVVILGHTRGSINHYNFQAGQCDRGDRATTITASREAQEETGGFVKISPAYLKKQPYIAHAKKQLFFVRDNRLSVRQITHACAKACHNSRLPRCYREVDHVVAVPLTDLLRLAAHIKNNNIRSKAYRLYSRTGNKPVYIDGFYMRMVAHRLTEVRHILNHMFPGARF